MNKSGVDPGAPFKIVLYMLLTIAINIMKIVFNDDYSFRIAHNYVYLTSYCNAINRMAHPHNVFSKVTLCVSSRYL